MAGQAEASGCFWQLADIFEGQEQVDAEDTLVRDRHPMRVATEVLEYRLILH